LIGGSDLMLLFQNGAFSAQIRGKVKEIHQNRK